MADADDAADVEVEPSDSEDVPTAGNGASRRRTRTNRTFPASSFMEALPLAQAIQRYAAGQRVRRLTLFEHMDRSAESGPSRQLITNSGQYGLTTGSYSAEFLELTPDGDLASREDASPTDQLAARLKLAIEQVEPFNRLYQQFSNNRLPAQSVLRDFVVEHELTPRDHVDECVETFLANARELGLVTTYAGAERMLTFEMLLEEAAPGAQPAGDSDEISPTPPVELMTPERSPTAVVAKAIDLSDVCFVVSPIGGPESEQRRHADLMFGSLLEPALSELGLRLIRADRISKPGLITAQVIDHLVRAPLVVADLSFGNPNVFYELAIRHATRRPVVQIVRAADPLPFDVGQFRTVVIDMQDIYALVPQIDRHRAEIARQCRSALEGEGPAESPLSLFYPRFWDLLADGSPS